MRDPYTGLAAPVSVFPGGSRPTPGQQPLNLLAAGYREPSLHLPCPECDDLGLAHGCQTCRRVPAS